MCCLCRRERGLVVVLDDEFLACFDDDGRDLRVVVLRDAGEDVVRRLVVQCTCKRWDEDDDDDDDDD